MRYLICVLFIIIISIGCKRGNYYLSINGIKSRVIHGSTIKKDVYFYEIDSANQLLSDTSNTYIMYLLDINYYPKPSFFTLSGGIEPGLLGCQDSILSFKLYSLDSIGNKIEASKYISHDNFYANLIYKNVTYNFKTPGFFSSNSHYYNLDDFVDCVNKKVEKGKGVTLSSPFYFKLNSFLLKRLNSNHLKLISIMKFHSGKIISDTISFK